MFTILGSIPSFCEAFFSEDAKTERFFYIGIAIDTIIALSGLVLGGLILSGRISPLTSFGGAVALVTVGAVEGIPIILTAIIGIPLIINEKKTAS